MPWPLEKFCADTIALIEEVCEPPVTLVGISFGSAIAQQVAIDRPDLVRSAIVMGTGALSTGWGWDYQKAEIDLRRAGGRLDGMFAVTHYAAMLFPAKVLGDRELWPKLRADLVEWLSEESNEESLIPQWESCLLYDQSAQLPECQVPMHVVAFARTSKPRLRTVRNWPNRLAMGRITSSRKWVTVRSTATPTTS